MKESPEVQIARLDERLNVLIDWLESDQQNKKDLHRWMGSVDISMERMSARLENVERSLASTAPTINEFVTLKNKVIGAGALGKWVWAGAAALLTWIYSIREHLFDLLSRGH